MLTEAVPTIRRVGVLSNPTHPGEQSEWAATQAAAKTLNVNLNYYRIATSSDISEAIERAQSERCDGLLTFPEALSLFNRGTIAQFAARGRLPTVFGWKIYCQAGGLLSYGPISGSSMRAWGSTQTESFQGAKPADLPVELPHHIRIRRQQRYGQDARPYHPAVDPRPRRRGDRVSGSAMSAWGQTRRFGSPTITSGLSPTSDIPGPGRHFAKCQKLT